MKKPMTFLLALGMLLSLAACSESQAGQSPSTPPVESQTAASTSEVVPEHSEQPQTLEDAGNSNILIAYFTWADNTVVEEPYSSDYDQCLDRAADEKAENARPALASHVDNMEDYDIVFLGFPNWWYTLPMPVLTFVEEYDWSGKTVVPFVTHGTGGLSSTIRDLTAALPEDVTILDPIGVYRPEVDDSQPAVQAWIAGLDLEV